MAELILLRPVFPGKDYIDQLDKIIEILGTPDTATLNEICTAGLYRNSNERL
jgi:mitogen-activated protein kinase 7